MQISLIDFKFDGIIKSPARVARYESRFVYVGTTPTARVAINRMHAESLNCTPFAYTLCYGSIFASIMD